MTDTEPALDESGTPAGVSITAGLVTGWALTALGVSVIAATVGVCLYLTFSADNSIQFVGWFFVMLFFGAFPALMGLGLVIWGGRIVHRSRSKQRHG